jgi:hypothetical protein
LAAKETKVCRSEWNVATGVRRLRLASLTEVSIFAFRKMVDSLLLTAWRFV